MNYKDAVEKIKNIETRYDVMSIKVKGVSVWPFIRIKLTDKMFDEGTEAQYSGRLGMKKVLSTLFYYNPLRFFKSSKYWIFSGFERRKQVGDKAVMRVSGGIVEIFPSARIIEKPSAQQHSFPKDYIKERNVISESWFLLAVHLRMFLLKPFKLNVQNEVLLNQIIAECGVSFNVQSVLRQLVSQRVVMSRVLSLSQKPNKVFIECPYPVMGYVWALHNKGIEVVEMQHGVLNNQHYAYNSLYHSSILYPDKVCVFGDVEYQYLMSDESHYCKNVIKTGLYFMEVAEKSFMEDPFAKWRGEYESIVLVAGQTDADTELTEYVNLSAKEMSNVLFLYVPRHVDDVINVSGDNVLLCPGVNIYEYMKWCDIHVTVTSTTCLECQYFHVPTIFYDVDNKSSSYYGAVLTEDNGVLYTKSHHDFPEAYKKVKSGEYKYKEIFSRNTTENISGVLNDKN